MNLKSKWTIGRVIAAAGVMALAFSTAGSTNTNALSAPPGNRVPTKIERADQLIGRDVWTTNANRIGQINDFVVDLDCGRVLYAVVSVSGFAGIGERRIAVPAGAFWMQGEQWRVDADKATFKSAPRFAREQEAHLEDPAFVGNVFKHFNQTTWWGADVQFNNVHKVSELIGMNVRDLSDKKIGEVNNLAIDLPAGRVVCVVLVPARGAGERNSLCALPPNVVTASADGGSLNTSIDPEKLAMAPRFEKDQWPDMTDPAWVAKLYQYYGKQAYFDNGEFRATGRTNVSPRIYHEPDEPKR